MTRETFIERRFNAEHQRIIDHAVLWLEDMRDQGFTVTLRQLYYMFISEETWFPNTIQSYKRLGSIINDARLAGEIDWELIEDRGRNVETIPSWANPQEIMVSVVNSYQEDLWEGQERRVHVRIEKDALIGVVGPVCRRWRVPHIACRGYTSQSESYEAGKLLAQQSRNGLWPLVIYLGDHDPSGIDMTRDTADRLRMFAGEEIEVQRIALNYDQVEELRLPANPLKLKGGKLSDSRAKGYHSLFGNESWELDALKPRYVDQLLDKAISSVIDFAVWRPRQDAEERNQALLSAVLNRWPEVEEMFGSPAL